MGGAAGAGVAGMGRSCPLIKGITSSNAEPCKKSSQQLWQHCELNSAHLVVIKRQVPKGALPPQRTGQTVPQHRVRAEPCYVAISTARRGGSWRAAFDERGRIYLLAYAAEGSVGGAAPRVKPV